MTVIVGPWPNSTQVEGANHHNLSIDDLPFSVRPYSCLVYLNVHTVGDLIKKKPQDLLRVPNFGYKSLREVEEILLDLGITWGRETMWERSAQ